MTIRRSVFLTRKGLEIRWSRLLTEKSVSGSASASKQSEWAEKIKGEQFNP